jgi:hypothetical protein
MSENGVEKILWWLGLVIAPTVLIGIEPFHPQGFTDPPPGMYQYLSKPASYDPHYLTTPLINTRRHYTSPRVRENSGCWSSSRVNASISGCNQRLGIVGSRS